MLVVNRQRMRIPEPIMSGSIEFSWCCVVWVIQEFSGGTLSVHRRKSKKRGGNPKKIFALPKHMGLDTPETYPVSIFDPDFF